ncbi:aldehyde ferredoxin oxidoreductase N-terminal domain-containing protein [Chloroflexota bacterium]
MAPKCGYAGKILRADLISGKMTAIPTSDYADRFIGGRGIAARIYWDEVKPETRAFDPQNRLIFVTGPLAGYPALAGSRWQICGKSPVTDPERFFYSNLGGTWGAYLKFAGYDGVIVQGKADRPVYLLVQDGATEIRDASALWGQDSVTTRHILKSELGNSVRVVAIGPAAENLVPFATALADEDASACGLAAVMGAKNLKAIAVGGTMGRPEVADPEKLGEVTRYIRRIKPNGPRTFRKWMQLPPLPEDTRRQLCYGCIDGCSREVYETPSGEVGKIFCRAGFFYRRYAFKYYGRHNEVPFRATRACDRYGIDAVLVMSMIRWLSSCYEAGVLTDESTGIPISRIGSLEFIETLVRKIALRDGFGDVLARGLRQAADQVGGKAIELLPTTVDRNGQGTGYGPRLYIAAGPLYVVESRQPISPLHKLSRTVIKWKNWANGLEGAFMSDEVVRGIARRFWGSEQSADFTTYEGKALAAMRIQDTVYANECLGLCDQAYPIMEVEDSDDHVGDPTVESQLYSAVTGHEVNEARLNKLGERVFNLQRAVFVREGHRGRQDDRLGEFNYTEPLERGAVNPQCLVPGKDGRPVSRKGAVVDRKKYAAMMDEYYQLRGWGLESGLQTKAKLHELGLEDIARDLEPGGLIA